MFLQKATFKIGPWTYVTNDLNEQKTVETFYENELQKTNQK